jgi:hypothetical protein
MHDEGSAVRPSRRHTAPCHRRGEAGTAKQVGRNSIGTHGRSNFYLIRRPGVNYVTPPLEAVPERSFSKQRLTATLGGGSRQVASGWRT